MGIKTTLGSRNFIHFFRQIITCRHSSRNSRLLEQDKSLMFGRSVALLRTETSRYAVLQRNKYRSILAPTQKAFLVTTNSNMAPKISEGSDKEKVQSELDTLLQNGWNLNESESQIEKTYHFKTYTKVLDLHHTIGVASKAKNHHSIMTSEFGSLTVQWTTHHPPGLSEKDIQLARYCDEHAALIGTVDRSSAAKCGPPPSSSTL